MTMELKFGDSEQPEKAAVQPPKAPKAAEKKPAPEKPGNGEAPVNYTEEHITTLSSLAHIRLRSGMYIGRLGNGTDPDDGIYVLLKEVIDNSIDEFIMGYGKRVDIDIEGKQVRIRDYGRGIPLGKVIDCVSVINTGAKYNDEVFKFSVGLNGVGTKAVNALSSSFKVTSFRDGEYFEATFSRGELQHERKGRNDSEKNGTLVEFTPDEEIFGEYSFNYEFIEKRLWIYACLNRGLQLRFNNQTFKSQNGLLDFLQADLDDESLYTFIYFKNDELEYTFTHTNNYGENYFSFVNGQYTNSGGTHQSAFREGILKGINEFYKKNYNSADVRDGLVGAISVKLMEPVFESQTKNKLGNNDIRPWIVNDVKNSLIDFLHKNSDVAEVLERKIQQNEKLRKDLTAVQKEARAAAKRVSIKIPNLKDCKYHLGDRKDGGDTMIFITEGASAAGSMVAKRNAFTQAIFALKGKPQNVHGRNRAMLYKNAELYNLMKALGVEESIDDLRYDKIIVATDADVDGFHIRNLMLTFFLTYFEKLITDGRNFMLETPLFRVRNKKETRYCYSEKEKNEALKKISGAEITRFKGLGEISPSEFGQFIGDDMRLIRVGVDELHTVPQTLEFYMGKNTPERREFIMENLI